MAQRVPAQMQNRPISLFVSALFLCTLITWNLACNPSLERVKTSDRIDRVLVEDPASSNDYMMFRLPFLAKNPSLETDPETGFSFLKIDGYEPDLTDPYTPVLPLKLLRFMLPAGVQILDTRIEVETEEQYHEITIPGFFRFLEIDQDQGLGRFTPVKNFSGQYPKDNISMEVFHRNDSTEIHVLFYPVVYLADSKELTIFTRGYLLFQYR
jgi:hypothetical protein